MADTYPFRNPRLLRELGIAEKADGLDSNGIRYVVDAELAKLFGARKGILRGWRMPKRQFTERDIDEVLRENDVTSVSAEEVREHTFSLWHMGGHRTHGFEPKYNTSAPDRPKYNMEKVHVGLY